MRDSIGPSTTTGFVRLAGVFYRAVDPRHRALALDGSRVAGRYSSPTQPALYLSASPEGVEAAMIAHRTADSPPRQVLAFEVEADCIFDLRNHRRHGAAYLFQIVTVRALRRISTGIAPFPEFNDLSLHLGVHPPPLQ